MGKRRLTPEQRAIAYGAWAQASKARTAIEIETRFHVSMFILNGVANVMPAMLPDAPQSALDWQRDRAIASITGTCPVCHAVGDAVDGSGHMVQTEMTHVSSCIITNAPKSITKYIDQEGIRAILALGRA